MRREKKKRKGGHCGYAEGDVEDRGEALQKQRGIPEAS